MQEILLINYELRAEFLMVRYMIIEQKTIKVILDML
jgi:hypothetical protein